jgi:uncharacterized protein YecA (UPF0149 family)
VRSWAWGVAVFWNGLPTLFSRWCDGSMRVARDVGLRHARRPTLCGLSFTDKGKEAKTATWKSVEMRLQDLQGIKKYAYDIASLWFIWLPTLSC